MNSLKNEQSRGHPVEWKDMSIYMLHAYFMKNKFILFETAGNGERCDPKL